MPNVVGYYNGQPVYRDSQGCYIYSPDLSEAWDVNCPSTPNVPTSPQLPSMNSGQVSTGGVLIQNGGSWYNDLLNTVLGLAAIGQHQPYIPSTNQAAAVASAQQNTIRNTGTLPINYSNNQLSNAAGQTASSLTKFISDNSGVLLVAGAALLLFKSGRK